MADKAIALLRPDGPVGVFLQEKQEVVMLKRWGLLLVSAVFLLSACAEIAEQSDFEDDRPPSASEQSFEEYQRQRQLEMQQMMQQRMMRGGVQSNRPIQIGPGGGGAP